MTSLPPKPVVPTGPTFSVRGADGASWRASGEPGSASRGIGSRGRGSSRGGGRGGGGRGRNGRGGSKTSGATKNNETEPKPGVVAQPPSLDIKAPPVERSTSSSTVTSTTTQSSTNSDRTQRPKLNTRRASQQTARKVPTLAIDPSTPVAETPSGPTSATRPNNRRRRSTQQTPKATNPPSTVQTLTVDPRSMPGRSRKSLTSPPTPDPSSKDAPPHLSAGAQTTSFDMNVHNLVEQMRASVISHRPTTPGSHIDWAGDDDDSLPDLDDWGYTTKTDPGTAVVEKANIISPILEGQLKPLPDFSDVSKPASPAPTSVPVPAEPAEEHKPATESAQKKVETLQDSSKVDAAKADSGKSRQARRPSAAATTRPLQTNGKETGRSQPNTSRTFVNPLAHLVKPNLNKAPSNGVTPLKGHPSLPPKPVPAVVSPSPKPASEQSSPAEEKPASEESAEAPAKPQEEPKSIEAVTSTVPAAEQIEATLTTAVTEPALASDKTSSEDWPSRGGLSDSIHAPKPGSGLGDSVYIPKSSSTSSSESMSAFKATPHRAFNPGHGRSHTVGRPVGLRPGFSVPHPGPRHTRSGSNTPRSAQLQDFAVKHARTQSSPPTGEGASHRAPHATRPVITGDAISRLARTLGGAGITSPRSMATAAVNE
ncbi:hypothetical protein NEOLEDRAFT_1182235 [Neolentinus lepideus HHB14362 ss-1]|uniref:Uncharacterized protein n=1 Tax=Neolentinus lepideus HHB14362 ss-1 TaxID=1314782 RepID=A0A165PAJ0_9AGAM|nr:hypothetical protein NEOLEDRAFT_1182235 [Neolentinus lepideus HHB14362 ss-1]